jgi:hypothetical protein
MKRGMAAAVGLMALASAVVVPGAARAQDPASSKPVCLDANRIDHTEILNSHQILFYMLGRKIWINNLTGDCSTLTRSDGFIWESRIDKYCDNLETIRVIQTGQTCLLGAFTPYEKPHAS